MALGMMMATGGPSSRSRQRRLSRVLTVRSRRRVRPQRDVDTLLQVIQTLAGILGGVNYWLAHTTSSGSAAVHGGSASRTDYCICVAVDYSALIVLVRTSEPGCTSIRINASTCASADSLQGIFSAALNPVVSTCR